ncbi:uncharacterized protein TNCV_83381 [Trichonephila clavipes]|nr:uncharacterized protein TNCV_83381 [Trichonephila clavipes]
MDCFEAKESFALGKLPVDFAVNPKRGIDEEEIFATLALAVQPPARSITLDILPRDGSEFIHLSRLEELYTMDPCFFTARQKKMYKYRIAAQFFEKRATQFQVDKAILIKKFPLEFDLPGKDVKEWCKLCLGSKLYNEIYKEPCNEEVEACFPSLSIVSHLEQHMVKSLLKYAYRWFMAVNMHDSIAQWVFSLLMCLERPVEERCQKFLDVFKNAMRKRLRACDECECKQLNLMLAILDLNFRD